MDDFLKIHTFIIQIKILYGYKPVRAVKQSEEMQQDRRKHTKQHKKST